MESNTNTTRPAAATRVSCWTAALGRSAGIVGIAVIAMFAANADAALGDAIVSIQHDSTALRASSYQTTPMPGYDRHEITTTDGNTVHEFASPDGKVFAINFTGRSIPDMKTMLGSHYDEYLAAATAHRGNHHIMSFTTDSGLSVTIVKLPRGFQGQANLSSLVPRGVNLQDLR